jgi:hypothetical protein
LQGIHDRSDWASQNKVEEQPMINELSTGMIKIPINGLIKLEL